MRSVVGSRFLMIGIAKQSKVGSNLFDLRFLIQNRYIVSRFCYAIGYGNRLYCSLVSVKA